MVLFLVFDINELPHYKYHKTTRKYEYGKLYPLTIRFKNDSHKEICYSYQ